MNVSPLESCGWSKFSKGKVLKSFPNFLQCAVKAKLIELGTGSTSGGYIDDELPDYVMIMVANKRSKKQMRDDLQLFLNENTDTFVNWLHQVLDKLQEVTLPPASELIDISI